MQQPLRPQPREVLHEVLVLRIHRAVLPVPVGVVEVDALIGVEVCPGHEQQHRPVTGLPCVDRIGVRKLRLQRLERFVQVLPRVTRKVHLLPQILPVRQRERERNRIGIVNGEAVLLAVAGDHVADRLDLFDQLHVVRDQVRIVQDVDEQSLRAVGVEVRLVEIRGNGVEDVRQVAGGQHDLILRFDLTRRYLDIVDLDVGLFLQPDEAGVTVVGEGVVTYGGVLRQGVVDGYPFRKRKGDLIRHGAGPAAVLLASAPGGDSGEQQHAQRGEYAYETFHDGRSSCGKRVAHFSGRRTPVD